MHNWNRTIGQSDMERPLNTDNTAKNGDKALSKKAANSADSVSSVIWLKDLKKVAEGLSGNQRRTPEQGVRETALLMAMTYNRLNEEFARKGLKKRVCFLQSAGSSFLSKPDETRLSL
jgi:hypothetical protein